MRHVFTSIDIGTDTVKIVVCEMYNNKLNLLAASSVKSRGIKKGLITDVLEIKDSIKQAIDEVEGMLGIKIKRVITSIPSYFTEFLIVKGDIEITNEHKIITGDDITNVLNKSLNVEIEPNREILALLPIDFKLDETEVVKDPKEKTASHLSSRSILVTTPKKNMYSVISVLESLGLEVIDIGINSVGDINTFKDGKINTSVGAVINIGSETTTISVANKGIIVKSSVISLGGKSIDNDLSYIYKIDMKEALKLKEKFALAHKKYASVNDLYEVINKEGNTIKLNQFEVSEIVMSRIEEILTLSKKVINTLTNQEIEYIILTGGTSNMAHLEYMTEEILGKNAKIRNINLTGLRNNKYSSALGNIVYFIQKLKLKGKNYTMITSDDMENLSSTKKNLVISNESMLGKVFGYFFGE